MSFNLRIPTSVAEVKALAQAGVDKAKEAASAAEKTAAGYAQKGLDKASNVVSDVASKIPTVTINKGGK